MLRPAQIPNIRCPDRISKSSGELSQSQTEDAQHIQRRSRHSWMCHRMTRSEVRDTSPMSLTRHVPGTQLSIRMCPAANLTEAQGQCECDAPATNTRNISEERPCTGFIRQPGSIPGRASLTPAQDPLEPLNFGTPGNHPFQISSLEDIRANVFGSSGNFQ